ncbi:MAG: hypothetical protein H6835_09210 [Planctomycetes bacterium]|nr:hypothetical protein [Planctomycetota bacterium]
MSRRLGKRKRPDAEDLDFATRRQLGNFPQAYSHLALIDCALALEGQQEHPPTRA